jgi:hypothetical protein
MRGTADLTHTSPGVPASVLSRRCHGSLDAVTDSERRTLRPIGSTVHEVAASTGMLLAGLLALPSVRIFQGVRQQAADAPRIPHAISAGRRLILVDSVAWPPGRYTASLAGRIHCDGVYIGQSVVPLIAAVGHWRDILPPDHRVSAFVVVHPAARGDLALPAAVTGDLAWAPADQAARAIRARLPSGHQAVSIQAVLALLSAVDQQR